MKTIKFIEIECADTSPAAQRIKAFKKFFDQHGYTLCETNSEYIFLSMPPFSNFKIFFKKNTKIILDIRDGWSIAQRSGYGEIANSQPLKSAITRIIERIIIRKAYLTITCTNGLQDYLQDLSKKEILLIPNGVSDEDYNTAHEILKNKISKQENDKLIFCCAGKFSEYGSSHIKKLIAVILNRYKKENIVIQLIGSDINENSWISSYLTEISGNRARLEILPKMSRESLYKTMAKANFGLTVLRNPDYEFGTKIYDYIALGLPVVNYFDAPNNFTQYFDACLDVSFDKNTLLPEIRRSQLINQSSLCTLFNP